MHMCLRTRVHRGQKRALDFLALESQVLVSGPVLARLSNPGPSEEKSGKCPQQLSPLSSPKRISFVFNSSYLLIKLNTHTDPRRVAKILSEFRFTSVAFNGPREENLHL